MKTKEEQMIIYETIFDFLAWCIEAEVNPLVDTDLNLERIGSFIEQME